MWAANRWMPLCYLELYRTQQGKNPIHWPESVATVCVVVTCWCSVFRAHIHIHHWLYLNFCEEGVRWRPRRRPSQWVVLQLRRYALLGQVLCWRGNSGRTKDFVISLTLCYLATIVLLVCTVLYKQRHTKDFKPLILVGYHLHNDITAFIFKSWRGRTGHRRALWVSQGHSSLSF